MILFKPEHVMMILEGRKTQTRRLWKRARAKVGSERDCFTKPPWSMNGAKPFARVRITGVRQEQLFEISADDIRREGYQSRTEYLKAFAAINGFDEIARDYSVYVVDFELVKDAP